MEETVEPIADADEVIRLHDDIIREFGGLEGILDRGLLESALARPFQGLSDGTTFYPTLIEKAAVLFVGVVQNHAFVDGNKRTGAILMTEFLRRNGCAVQYDEEEIVNLCVETAAHRLTTSQVVDWLQEHGVRSE